MAHIMEVTVDEHGEIVIPGEAAVPLGLSPGLLLVAEEAEAGGVRLRVLRERSALVEKEGMLVARGELLCDPDNIITRFRDERLAKLIPRLGL